MCSALLVLYRVFVVAYDVNRAINPIDEMENNNMTYIFSAKWKRAPRRFARFSCFLLGSLLIVSETATEAAYPRSIVGKAGAVAADHELASKAGAEILSQGGNAVDAAIATALTLGVVQPAGSGLGGGGFLLFRKADGRTEVLDFREVAPKRAHRDLFLDAATGQAVPDRSRLGGLAVGVPGEPAGFAFALKKWGRLGAAQVVAPAVRWAEQGFPVGHHLGRAAGQAVQKLDAAHPLRTFLAPGGVAISVGQSVQRKELAQTLRLLGRNGFLAFYQTTPGSIGEDLLLAVRQSGGVLQADDLAAYKPVLRPALSGRYRGHQVLLAPAPAGGITVLEALHILDARPPFSQGSGSSATLHETIEALKHAFADRIRFHGDPAFTNTPQNELASVEYARARAAKILPERVLPTTSYGHPGTGLPGSSPKDAGTSHLCVIDGEGNVAALTTTVNLSFGARVVGSKTGVLLNNQMDDFSAKPASANAFGLVGADANLVAPGKRPASSMSPAIAVAPDGTLFCAGGSGGPTIVSGVLQTLVNLIDFGMEPEAAVSSPRIHAQLVPETVFVEPEVPADVREKLAQRGHKVLLTPSPIENAVQVVAFRPARDGKPAQFSAASDPRKGGKPAVPPSIAKQ